MVLSSQILCDHVKVKENLTLTNVSLLPLPPFRGVLILDALQVGVAPRLGKALPSPRLELSHVSFSGQTSAGGGGGVRWGWGGGGEGLLWLRVNSLQVALIFRAQNWPKN